MAPTGRRSCHARLVERVLAIDIGGTKLAAAIVDADGTVLDRDQTPTVGADADALFATLVDLVDGVRGGSTVVACGVGCGGPMAPRGETVSPLNIEQWREFPLRAALADRLGVAVHVDNDAKALAIGEGWRGAARGCADYLAMVVSTGVGGGLVVDGRVLDGAAGNAGHIGHVNVVPDGRTCACGALGCLEAEASGSAIAAITGRPAAEADDDVRRRTGALVGRAVGSVAALLDLRLAVVAGSVALGYGDRFFTAAQQALDDGARIGFARGVRIVAGGLGDAGPLVGAAAVAWRGLGRDVGVR